MRPASTLLATILTAFTSSGYSMESLAAYEWKNRVVVVFGKSDDLRTVQQIETFRSVADALAERDIVVFYVGEHGVISLLGEFTGIDARKLRAEAGVGDGQFKVLLIGKDGGIKLVSDEPASDIELLGTVDEMPMRRSEMKRGD